MVWVRMRMQMQMRVRVWVVCGSGRRSVVWIVVKCCAGRRGMCCQWAQCMRRIIVECAAGKCGVCCRYVLYVLQEDAVVVAEHGIERASLLVLV